MNTRTAIPGSARLQRAGDGVLADRELSVGACSRSEIAHRNERCFGANAETSTQQACAPRIPPSQPQWMFGS